MKGKEEFFNFLQTWIMHNNHDTIRNLPTKTNESRLCLLMLQNYTKLLNMMLGKRSRAPKIFANARTKDFQDLHETTKKLSAQNPYYCKNKGFSKIYTFCKITVKKVLNPYRISQSRTIEKYHDHFV